MYERIKELCRLKNTSVNKLEQALGFAKGSLCRIDINKPSVEKLLKIAKYFNVGIEYLTGEGTEGSETYYLNDETAKVSQEIFKNKNLRLLFNAARDASPEDLLTTYNMLMALRKKERGFDDNTGC